MTADTSIDSSHGPVNSGSGHQYILYPEIRESAANDSSGRNPRQAGVEELRALRRRFVHPPGCDLARRLLEDNRAVLLRAHPGHGAVTAAKVLLCELPQGAQRFRELVDQAVEEDAGRAVDAGQVEEGAALLLDLSEVPERRYAAFMAELPGLLKIVRARGAWLAVVLPQEWRAGFDHLLQRLVSSLGRPDALHVLRAHLRGRGICPSPSELAGKELELLLANATMTGVAELAEEIASGQAATGEAATGEAGFEARLSAALEARRPGMDDVEKHLAALQSGTQRALLLTTALLHGARTDTIHEAAIRLVRTAEHPEVDTPPLQHRTLSARLSDIKATADAASRVRFDAPAYDDRVRTYFWDNYPQLRASLGRWVSQAPGFPALAASDRLELVTRFARECLRTGPPEGLTDLAERWTRPSASKEELSMAARALGEGVGHPRYGSVFRHRLYVWAQDAALPAPRANVLIGVCSEVLSRRFPDQAMVRLRHLSRHHQPGVRETAREALSRITDSDHRLYRSLLSRLRPGADQRGRRDLAVFLRVADPSRLVDDSDVRGLLADHWTTALATVPSTDWEEPLRRWLDRAHARPGTGRTALSTLAEACARHRAAFGAVYAVACAWAGADPERIRTVDALWATSRSAPGPVPAPASH
ncbi:hypothetical protein [Streptomyces spirodelae]|uniref:HEAT repeat domain-containing protein n=1 Tax=Streptomyces spirodelae TaxID=2812904 RepID=A0ABS3WX95_9ACTN|nr:hypothetical protein [Streptomyces spirodelae]MBO8187751.1 hypothetical protein [Streptomyces spirodelae]